MKKSFLLILCLFVATTVAVAKSPTKHVKYASKGKKYTKKMVGEQCCTKTYNLGNGQSISLTACAGWFLSNNVSAMARACTKVDDAAKAYFQL